MAYRHAWDMPRIAAVTGTGVHFQIARKKNPAERLTRGISSRMWR